MMRAVHGLIEHLGQGLRQALAEGAERDRAVSADGERWLFRWALIAALAGAILFLFCGYHGGFLRLNGLAAEASPWIWEWLTMLGDERLAFSLALIFSRRRPRVFWTLLVAGSVAAIYSSSLKHLFSAPRPPAVLDADDFNLIGPGHRKSSFPSGHTVTASVFFGVWVYFLRGAGTRGLMIALALAAGLSRVALGVHWPVDVAAGMFGGVLAAWVGAMLARKAEWGIRDPWVHLAFVTMAAFPAIALLLWDGGYASAAGFQLAVGAAALVSLVLQYLFWPLWGFLTVNGKTEE